MSWSKYIHTILCYFPWLFIIAFYSFALRAVITLGYIPSYGSPDPKDLDFYLHRNLVYYLFVFTICELPFALLVVGWFWKKGRWFRINILVFVIAFLLMVYMFFINNNLISWFAD